MNKISCLLLVAAWCVCFGVNAQPLNDDCSSATPITVPASGDICVNGSLAGATDDGFYTNCESPGSEEVWFTYIVTGANNSVVVNPTGSTPATNLVVSITSFGCGNSGVNACNAATTANGSATATWSYSAGTQIWISVSSNSSSTGTFQVCITSTTTPPSNGKDCSTAVPICSMNSFTAPVTVGANGFQPPCFTSALQQPIIFQFTVGQTGLLNWVATPTCGAPNATTTEFDWAVYDITSGCPGSVVACNYNYTAFGLFPTTCPQGMTGGPTAGCSRTSVTGSTALEICPGVTVTAGRTYVIMLDQFTTGSACSLDFNFNGSTFQMAPTSSFTITPTTGCESVTVNFSNTSVASSSYTWTFGDGSTSNAQNPPSKTYGTVGTYLVSLSTTSASGCTSVASNSVQVVPNPVVSANDTTVCPGKSATLTATPDITGGTYSWSPGGATTQSITVSPASTTAYTVTYTLLGCSGTANATVNIAPAAFTVNAGNDTSICSGNSTILDASVQPNGSYTYTWTPTPTLTGANTLTPIATPANTTTYTISVTDADGCVKTDGVQVTTSTASTVAASVNPTSICSGQQVQLGAVVNPPSSTITWSPSSGSNSVSNPGIANPTANPTSTQKYMVTASNNGCTSKDSVTVLVDTSRVDAGADRTICLGTSTNLSATLIGSVSPGPSSFSWTDLSNNSLGNTQNVTVSPPTTTTYIVTMNGGACVKRDTVTISIGSLTPGTVASNTTCNGIADGKIKVTIVSTPPHSFSWSPNANTGNVDSAVNLSPGSYQVTVIDGNNCSGTASATISEPLVISITPTITDVKCFGDSTGSISLIASGGTGSYSYNWSNSQTGSAIMNLKAGNYSVTVLDANQCSITGTFPITEPTAPLTFGNASITNLSCNGGGSGTITVNVVNGTPNYSFAWSHNSALNSATASSLSANTYTVTVTDANGCTASQSNTVTQPTPIIFGAPVISNTSCNGSNDGSIQITPNGGTGNYSYTWNGLPGGNPMNNLTGGTYTIIVTDGSNCTASTSATIDQPSALVVDTNVTDASCYLASDGSISLVTSGGVPPYIYNWAGMGTSRDLSALTGGTYFCTVTDRNGCSVGVSAEVHEPGPLSMSLQSTGVSCTGDWDGSITVSPQGGTPPYSSSATPDGGIFFFGDSVISGLPTDLYLVILADNNGCIQTDTISVPDAIADEFIITTDSTSCFGESYQDGAIYVVETSLTNRPYQYSVDGHAFQATGDFFNLKAGEHIIRSVNGLGCETFDTVIIGSPVDATLDIFPSDTVLELGQSIQLQVTFGSFSTSSINSYNWSPTLGLSCIDCPAPFATPYNRHNDYTLMVTYNEKCMVSTSATINIESRPEIFIPNTFTPNGDGNNDVFQIYGEAIKTVDIKIFNRWGELVYQSNNQFSGWDGRYKNQIQNPGVFTYTATITYLDNKVLEKNGTLTLMK